MADLKTNILIVDDEPKITEVISSFLESRGFGVFSAADGRRAMEIFGAGDKISLIVLDLMLPDISGEELCRAIRAKDRTPIIMLTAKSAEDDMLKGLGLGADDYIVKPFSLKELHARIEAVLRRAPLPEAPSREGLRFNGGDLTVDFEKNVVERAGRPPVSLTPSELKLLSVLSESPGKIFTRDELIAYALGDEFDGYDRTVDSHIRNLRRKIGDDPRSPVYVLTAYGLGYKFGGERP
jgi:DNA-binding response OmpR family regulator